MKATVLFTAAFDESDRHGTGLVWTVTILENPEARTRLYVDDDEDLTQALRDDIIAEEIALLVAKTA